MMTNTLTRGYLPIETMNFNFSPFPRVGKFQQCNISLASSSTIAHEKSYTGKFRGNGYSELIHLNFVGVW